jgi:mRNA-degrading endonuclease RelE of RelBE toxin-antitoxin system
VAYRVLIDPLAQDQIDRFAEYLREYSEPFAVEQIDRLQRILQFDIGESPLMWGYFPLTGAPYRGYLFRVGRRTHYWIIYTVDVASRTVIILSFWNTARDPETLDL